MSKFFYIIGVWVFLVLSGCASQTERAGIDVKKASAANSELGIAYLAQGKLAVAMGKLKKAIRYNDENVDAHHYIAEIYRRLNQNGLAKEHFDIAIDLDENNSSIQNNYGIFLCGTGKYEEGMKFFNKVLTNPLYLEKGPVYENMGVCVEKLGNIRHSEKYFETALLFNKKLPTALLGLAQIKFDKKNIKVAADYLDRHNKLARPSSQSLWLGLLIARKRGLKGQAGSFSLKIKQFFPKSKEAGMLKKLKLH